VIPTFSVSLGVKEERELALTITVIDECTGHDQLISLHIDGQHIYERIRVERRPQLVDLLNQLTAVIHNFIRGLRAAILALIELFTS
jgi:hypothetical protein